MGLFTYASRCFRAALVTALLCAGSLGLCAQEEPATANTEPDTLVLTNGEKLIGHLEKSVGASVTFKSETAGVVTVDWSKVKELHAGGRYAVITKDVKVGRIQELENVPQGTVAVTDQKLEVTTAQGSAPRPVPVGDTAFVVNAGEFRKVTEENPGFFHDWRGGITGGVSLVEATQKSRVFSGAVNLNRVEPAVDWLSPRNRTTANFNASYGRVSEPKQPDIKTEIYHLDAERDEYFSKRAYVFAQAALDHNFSQGLDLQQLYGGGVGITTLKRPNQELDFKASINYIRQSFSDVSNNKNLIGVSVSDAYFYKLPLGILFTQGLTFTPALNDTSAFSATGNAGLVFPAYKRFSASLNLLDTFLNDPPAGFQKNSLQFTAGITYVLK